MNVKSITVGMFATNCYLVSCPETKEGVVIDPGADGKRIFDKLKNSGLRIKYIINTHGHIDHIGANGKLKEVLKIPILLCQKDLELYNNPGFGLRLVSRKQPDPDKYISEGERIEFGNLSMTVINTPGHTPGGVCLIANSALFSGDTLFAGSIGRTDLAGGSHSALIKSIKEKIIVLPPETMVYPGHGPITTIGEEIETNPFIKDSYG